MINPLIQLFENHFKVEDPDLKRLPIAGSNRKYFRLTKDHHSAIGVIGEDFKENQAFLAFSKTFKEIHIPVPEIYSETEDGMAYLQEDLGDTSLFELVTKTERKEGQVADSVIKLYEKSLSQLVELQTKGDMEIDYYKAYPAPSFMRSGIQWDLNYFKYYYVKPSGIPFNEFLLDIDFQSFGSICLNNAITGFMYRDFQSRNILIKGDNPYFIDYQGGRKGPLAYDLASLLFQAKAKLPENQRNELIDFYINELGQKRVLDSEEFKAHFYNMVLLRTMQVLGAYGFRGIFERKAHFLTSIPFAIQNLKYLLEGPCKDFAFKEIRKVLEAIIATQEAPAEPKHEGLTVKITSFSYKKSGIPSDESGNGGGFVFDCRSIHNPGRYQPYKIQTGRDQPVIDFLLESSHVEAFMEGVLLTVEPAVQNYLERGFQNLMVSFGCTGGQHRSVYCADQLAKFLEEKYDVKINLIHIEQEKKGWVNG